MSCSLRRTTPGVMGQSSFTGDGNIQREWTLSRYSRSTCTTAGGSGTLRAFYCDSVRVNGRDLGRQLVAVSPDIYGDSGFQGVWRMEEQEGAHELVQAALE